MFARMRALLFVVAGLGTTAAYADPSPTRPTATRPAEAGVHAGAQAVPPVHAAEPTLTEDLEARRIIRGCDADEPCARPSEVLRENVYVTTSGNFLDSALVSVLMELGPERVLFGSDYPWESLAKAVAFVDAAPISDADRRKIWAENALRLFAHERR